MLDDICTSETGIISDGRTDGQTHGKTLGSIIPRHKHVAGYEYYISKTHTTEVTKTYKEYKFHTHKFGSYMYSFSLFWLAKTNITFLRPCFINLSWILSDRRIEFFSR